MRLFLDNYWHLEGGEITLSGRWIFRKKWTKPRNSTASSN